MLFLHAKVIPVNPQIHANVMRPLCVLIFFIFFFNHCLSDIVLFLKFLLGIHSLIKYVHIVNAELIESTLKQTIICLCFDDLFMALEIQKMVRAYNMYCSLHLINVHIKKIQITILLFKNRFTIYDLRLPSTTLNFAITFYRKS
jgi:hypothetical protein